MKPDWEAIKRDFATGKFTFRELAEKYKEFRGTSKSAIEARSKKEGWTQDLRDVVRQATDAALIRETVAKAAQGEATNAVLAAAEVNKQVILQHRQDLNEARSVAAALLAELRESTLLAGEKELLAQVMAGSGADPKDEAEARRVVSKALQLGGRISSVKALAEALTKLQAAERLAFGIDDGDDPVDGVKAIIKDFTGRKRGGTSDAAS